MLSKIVGKTARFVFVKKMLSAVLALLMVQFQAGYGYIAPSSGGSSSVPMLTGTATNGNTSGSYSGLKSMYKYNKGQAIDVYDPSRQTTTQLVAGKQSSIQSAFSYSTLQYQYDKNGEVVYVYNPSSQMRTSYVGSDGLSTGKAQYDEVYTDGAWIKTAKYNYVSATSKIVLSKEEYGFVGKRTATGVDTSDIVTANNTAFTDWVDVDGNGNDQGYAVVRKTFYDEFGDENVVKGFWSQRYVTSGGALTTNKDAAAKTETGAAQTKWVQEAGSDGQGELVQKYLYDKTGQGKKMIAAVGYQNGEQKSLTVYQAGYDKWTFQLKEGVTASTASGVIKLTSGSTTLNFNGAASINSSKQLKSGTVVLANLASENTYSGTKKVSVTSYETEAESTLGKKTETSFLDDFGRVDHTISYDASGNVQTGTVNGKTVTTGTANFYNDSTRSVKVTFTYPMTLVPSASSEGSEFFVYVFGQKIMLGYTSASSVTAATIKAKVVSEVAALMARTGDTRPDVSRMTCSAVTNDTSGVSITMSIEDDMVFRPGAKMFEVDYANLTKTSTMEIKYNDINGRMKADYVVSSSQAPVITIL